MFAERRQGFVSGFLAGIAVALVVAVGIAAFSGELGDDESELNEQARSVIEANYFRAVGDGDLDQASVKGMVNELRNRFDDRFSHFFTPEQLEDFTSSTSGEFEGIGLTVSESKRGLRISSVIPDTPAARAGFKRGDVITEVDGRKTAGVPAEVSTGRIKGEPGTPVELKVAPRGEAKTRYVTIERARVRVPAVESAMRRSDGRKVAHVEFRSFSDGAHGELREELERLYDRGAKALVLDLRGNGGGLLNEAVLSSSIFVDEGKIVSTRSRTKENRTLRAVGDALKPRPTVVLIDRASASASEILTAALSDHGLATVVGQRSFGKGSVQEVIRLPAGGALDLTVGEFFTPEGKNLAGKGIAPDLRAVDDPETRPDEALREALAVLADE